MLPKTPTPPKRKIDRTSLVGYLLIIVIVVVTIAVYNGKFSLNDFGSFLNLIFGLLVGLGFIFSKDGRKT